jgi:hypothetical protein
MYVYFNDTSSDQLLNQSTFYQSSFGTLRDLLNMLEVSKTSVFFATMVQTDVSHANWDSTLFSSDG